MHKLSIWHFMKVEYLAMSKDQKTAAVEKYVHAIKNWDTCLNCEFIISSRKLLFLSFFPSSYSVGTFETSNHGHCFTTFTSGWCEWYTVLTSLNQLEIAIFLYFFSSNNDLEFIAEINLILVSKDTTNRDILPAWKLSSGKI